MPTVVFVFLHMARCDERMDAQGTEHCGDNVLNTLKAGKWGPHSHFSTSGSSEGPEVVRRAEL